MTSQTMLCAAVLASMLAQAAAINCCVVAESQCVQGFEAVNTEREAGCTDAEFEARTCYPLQCCGLYQCRKTREQGLRVKFTEHDGLPISHPQDDRVFATVERSLKYLEQVCKAKHHDRVVSYKVKQHTHLDGGRWVVTDFVPRIYEEVVCEVFLG